MDNDVPRKCAERGGNTLRTRFALTLTLASLTFLTPAFPAPIGAGLEAEAAGGDVELGPAAGSVDPRVPEVHLLAVEPAPGGRWVALHAERQRPHRQALWFVDLETGAFRAWEQGEPTGAPMTWRDGRLCAEVRTEGAGSRVRRSTVAIDPSSGAFDEVERKDALAADWADTVITRRSGGRRVLTIEWSDAEASFELPGGPDTEYRLAEAPGVVFYTEPDRGAVRIWRHDLARGTTSEVATLGGLDPHWNPSPDGLLVALSDDYRTRLVDAQDGETISGPWPAGRSTWLERDGHGHVMLTAGGHRHVLDVYAERRVHLGPEEGPEPDVRVLAGGGFLVHQGEQLDYLDEAGELIQNLVPGAPRVDTAAR